MREDYKKKLIEWKRNSVYGETRSITYKPIKLEDGTEEYYIELRIAFRVRVGQNSKEVVETAKLFTQAQSNTTPNNPNGDLYLFDIFAKTLFNNFENEYNATVDNFLQQINPDGFLSL